MTDDAFGMVNDFFEAWAGEPLVASREYVEPLYALCREAVIADPSAAELVDLFPEEGEDDVIDTEAAARAALVVAVITYGANKSVRRAAKRLDAIASAPDEELAGRIHEMERQEIEDDERAEEEGWG